MAKKNKEEMNNFEKFYTRYFKKSKIIIILVLSFISLGLFSFMNIPKATEPAISLPGFVTQLELDENVTIDEFRRDVVTPLETELLEKTERAEITSNVFSVPNLNAMGAPDGTFRRAVVILAMYSLEDEQDLYNSNNKAIKEILTFFNPRMTFDHDANPATADEVINAGKLTTTIRDIGIRNDSLIAITTKDASDISNTANQEKLEAAAASIRNIDGIKRAEVITIENDPLRPANFYFSSKSDSTVKVANYIGVSFKAGIDATKYKKDVETALSTMDGSSLEHHWIVDGIQDVQKGVNSVISNLIQAIIFVGIVVFVGLGLRSALSIAISFPLIIFCVITINYAMGYTLESMMIAGLIITIGIIVDNSVVVAEAIQYNLDQGKEKVKAISLAVKDNAVPILSSTLTTIAAFIPMLMIPGIAKKFTETLTFTVITSISLSYISALLVLPLFAKFFMKKAEVKKGEKKKFDLDKATRAFATKISRLSFKRPLVVLGSVFALLLGSGALLLNSKVELLPNKATDLIYVDYTVKTTETAEDYKDTIMADILKFEEVNSVSLATGGEHPSFTFNLPGLSYNVKSARIAVNTKLNETKTTQLAVDIENTLKRVHGEKLDVISSAINISQAGPDMELSITGKTFNEVKTNVVKFNAAFRHASEQGWIKGFTEGNIGDGNIVGPDAGALTIIDGKYGYAIKVYSANGHSVEKIINNIEGHAPALFNNNDEVVTKWSGTAEANTNIMSSMAFASIITTIVITIILLFQFNSFKKILIILSVVPLSIIGSITLMFILGQSISMVGMLGLIALIGIVVNNAILLVEKADRNIESGMNVEEAIVDATSSRARPIIISNTTTIFGLIPLALFGGAFFVPMAIIMIGGLLTSSTLVALVTPALYNLLFNKKKS